MTRTSWMTFSVLAAVLTTASLFAAEEKKTEDSTDRQRAAENYAALFDKLDVNHDGQITADEVPEESRRLFERLLRRADRNGDGKLSREEFIAGMEQGPGGPGDRPNEAGPGNPPQGRGFGGFAGGAMPGSGPGPFMGMAIFRALDTNGDGKLDAKEIAAAADVLKKLANSDGEITREELLKSLPQEIAASAKGGGVPGGGGLAGMNPDAAFKLILQQFDKNGDGKLQKDELPRPLQDRFEELDTNKDGALDQSELKEIMPRLLRRIQLERAQGGAGQKGKKSDSN
jgi:Ca2+-binding EF-hand superfamily protein